MPKQHPDEQPLIFNDKNELILKNAFYGLLRLAGVLIALIIKMIPVIILYAILSFIYLSVYEASGFETAIILLLVGVIVFASRGNKR